MLLELTLALVMLLAGAQASNADSDGIPPSERDARAHIIDIG